MSNHIERELVAGKAVVHEALPKGRSHEVDRSFELPPIAYGLTAACYFAFLGLMIAAVGNPGLIIPMAICAVFFVGFFGVPSIWVRMHPEDGKKAMTWGQFNQRGISTLTGRLGAGEAMAQVLVLPVLIVCWGLVIAVMVALV